MITIHLHHLIFFAFHGLHEEEKILGNEYEVNAEVSIDALQTITRLEQTVDYATIYEIIKKRMAIPTGLLETVTQELTQEIKMNFPLVRSVSISIRKKYPPIVSIEGSVGVSYKKEY